MLLTLVDKKGVLSVPAVNFMSLKRSSLETDEIDKSLALKEDMTINNYADYDYYKLSKKYDKYGHKPKGSCCELNFETYDITLKKHCYQELITAFEKIQTICLSIKKDCNKYSFY